MKKLSMLLAVMMISTGALAQSKKDAYSIIGGKKAISLAGEGGGSSVGGGTVYSSIISWCDSSALILDSAREEASEFAGLRGDRIGAIATLYNGLLAALQDVNNGEVTFNNSITFKAITRGIEMANRMGVRQIIDGSQPDILSQTELQRVIDFMMFYYSFVSHTSEKLDKKFYAPYITKTVCTNCPGQSPDVGTKELEKEFINYSINQIKSLRDFFVRYRGSKEGYYSTIDTVIYLKALSYLLAETSNDLDESLFSNAYQCQSVQLRELSTKVQFYVNTRGDASFDPYKLSDFTIKTDKLMAKILSKSCL